MIEHENYSTWYFCCRSSIRKSVSTCALGVAKCISNVRRACRRIAHTRSSGSVRKYGMIDEARAYGQRTAKEGQSSTSAKGSTSSSLRMTGIAPKASASMSCVE